MSASGRQTQRIDKILVHLGYGSRSDIKRMVKLGSIVVNDKIIKDSGLHVNPYKDHIEVDGETVSYKEYIYLMLHKPQGVISATEDARESTVLDLLEGEYLVFEPFPVGRLDKDTEGLLLLTNDGKLAHELLSPRRHVPKTYEARVKGNVNQSDVEQFAAGVTLEDGYKTLPSQLTILGQEVKGEDVISSISLTIHEGKFHQVKRMFEAVGKKVIYLKRVSMGDLKLDPQLPLGSYRELTAEELALIGRNPS